jgi:hypothetical protein
MPYNATIFQVMIASPGDVSAEREKIRAIVHEWNDLNSQRTRIVLLPVGWDTHSSPDLGGRPQDIINRNVLDKSDLLVGVFWTRIGTPTGEAESGTVEEIRRHIDAGKPAMVYFSSAPVAPELLDHEQFGALKAFKNWCKSAGLIEGYENTEEFSEKFRRQLQIIVRDHIHFQDKVEKVPDGGSSYLGETISRWVKNAVSLSGEATQLLIEATKDKNGIIMSLRFIGGSNIQSNGIQFADSQDRRSVARWEAALQELVDADFVVDRGHKGEVFEVTDKGYKFVETLETSS